MGLQSGEKIVGQSGVELREQAAGKKAKNLKRKKMKIN